MSGGHYDYAYCHIHDLACQIKNDDIQTKETKILAKLLKDVGTLCYELEWWKSGDTAEKDFIKAFNKFNKKWRLKI